MQSTVREIPRHLPWRPDTQVGDAYIVAGLLPNTESPDGLVCTASVAATRRACRGLLAVAKTMIETLEEHREETKQVPPPPPLIPSLPFPPYIPPSSSSPSHLPPPLLASYKRSVSISVNHAFFRPLSLFCSPFNSVLTTFSCPCPPPAAGDPLPHRSRHRHSSHGSAGPAAGHYSA